MLKWGYLIYLKLGKGPPNGLFCFILKTFAWYWFCFFNFLLTSLLFTWINLFCLLIYIVFFFFFCKDLYCIFYAHVGTIGKSGFTICIVCGLTIGGRSARNSSGYAPCCWTWFLQSLYSFWFDGSHQSNYFEVPIKGTSRDSS